MDKTKVLVIIALLISICSFGKEVSNIPGQASADNENIPQSSGRPVQTLRGVVNDRASGHPIPYATIQLTDIPGLGMSCFLYPTPGPRSRTPTPNPASA